MQFKTASKQLVARSIDVAFSSLPALFASLAPQTRAFYRCTPDADCIEILALGVAAQNNANANDSTSFTEQFKSITKCLENTDPSTRQHAKIFGWSAFDPESPESATWTAYPRRTLYIPQLILTRHANNSTATIIAPKARIEDVWGFWGAFLDPGPKQKLSESTEPKITWLDRDAFYSGTNHVTQPSQHPSQHPSKAAKVVLARRALVETDAPINIRHLLDTLGKKYPTCTTFGISAPENTEYPAFLGATPERLVHGRKSKIETMALAGTAQHADHALVDSAKELEEHIYVRDMIVETLKPISRKVTVAPAPTVKHLANVSHLLTPISATLKTDANLANVVDALHPTPAVCGTPTELARQEISQLEQFDRGLYAGTFGWLDLKGNGEFDVALRCGLVGQQSAILFAGAGITASSDADAEWSETGNKFKPLLHAIASQFAPKAKS